jgi:hypothetical protein
MSLSSVAGGRRDLAASALDSYRSRSPNCFLLMKADSASRLLSRGARVLVGLVTITVVVTVVPR